MAEKKDHRQKQKKDSNPPATLPAKSGAPECPLCEVSEETLKKLKESKKVEKKEKKENK